MSLGAIFKRGLWLLMPAMITIAAMGLIYNICEGGYYGQGMRYLVSTWLPSVYSHFPEGQGVSFLSTIVLVTALGVIGSIPLGMQLLTIVNSILTKFPIIRIFYGPALNVSEVFLDTDPKSQKISFQRVVKVPITDLPIMIYGLVAGEEVRDGRKYLDIFVPHSPTFSSGIITEVPEDKCVPVHWSIESAVRFLVSCGLLKPALNTPAAPQSDNSQSKDSPPPPPC